MSPAAAPTPPSAPAADNASPDPTWKPYLRALAGYIATMLVVIALLPSNYMWQGHDALTTVLRTQWLAEVWRAEGPGVSPWLPQALYGYGYPMFHYYAPLSYAITVGLHVILGIGAGSATKASFHLSWILSGIAAWALATLICRRDKTADGPLWSLAAAFVYSLAPYHLCDLFSRGGLAECWAWATLAALFLAIEWSRRDGGFGALLIGVTWGGLVLSHNIFALYGTVLAVLYVLLTCHNWRWLFTVAAGALFGAALSAYFWLPSLALLPWVHGSDPGMMLGTSEFLKEHAVHWGQWLLLAYGRGGSHAFIEPDFPANPGPELAAAMLLAFIALFRGGLARAARRRISACAALIALLVLAASPVMPWEIVPTMLRYLQFPWRLVLPVVLIAIIAVVSAAPAIGRWISPRLLIGATLLLNLPGLYFLLFVPVSKEFSDATLISEMRLRDEYEMESAGSIALEYLPVGVSRDIGQRDWQDKNPVPSNRLTPLEGEITRAAFTRIGTQYDFQYSAATTATAKLHIIFLPNWQLMVDGTPAPDRIFQTGDGLIGVDLPAGDHSFSLRYAKSKIERLAGGISLIGLATGFCFSFILFALKRKQPAVRLHPRFAVAAVTGVLIAGVVAEFMLRSHITRTSKPSLEQLGQPAPRHQYSPLTINQLLVSDPEIDYRLAPDVRGEWQGAPVIIDARGFRVAPSVSSPTPGLPIVRIAGLGGSAMFGWGIPAEDTLLENVRRHLTSRLGLTARVETINGAVPGHTTAQQVAWAKRSVLPLNPDIVFLQHDLAQARLPLFESGRIGFFEMPWILQPGKWAGDSLIVDSLMKSSPPISDFENTREAIERLSLNCRERGIALISIVTGREPARFGEQRILLAKMFDELRIPCLDVNFIEESLRKNSLLESKFLFLDNAQEAHTSPLMNEIAANAARSAIPGVVAGTRLEQMFADAPASAKLDRPLDNELYVAPDSFHNSEDWVGEPVRWTQRRAKLIAMGEGKSVKVKWWVGNPDVYTTRPLTVTVRANDLPPKTETFTESGVVGETVFDLGEEGSHIVQIEIEADRMFFKPGDRRLLGIGLYPVTFE